MCLVKDFWFTGTLGRRGGIENREFHIKESKTRLSNSFIILINKRTADLLAEVLFLMLVLMILNPFTPEFFSNYENHVSVFK